MDGHLVIVSCLLGVAVIGLVVACYLLSSALARVDDRQVLASTIKAMTDAIVCEKDDQINRIRMEREAELGVAHIRGQVETARKRGDPVSNNGKDMRDSIHLDIEE